MQEGERADGVERCMAESRSCLAPRREPLNVSWHRHNARGFFLRAYSANLVSSARDVVIAPVVSPLRPELRDDFERRREGRAQVIRRRAKRQVRLVPVAGADAS